MPEELSNYTPPFTIRSGRQFWIQRFYFESTTYGVLCGRDESIREHLLVALQQMSQQHFGRGAYLILPPPGRLPRYLFMADCLSATDKAPDSVGGSSNLVIAWFGDSIPGDLQKDAAKLLEGIDWQKHATDTEI